MYWSWELLGYVEVARLIESETLVQRPMYVITHDGVDFLVMQLFFSYLCSISNPGDPYRKMADSDRSFGVS